MGWAGRLWAEAGFLSGQAMHAHIHIKIAFAGLSTQPPLCKDLDTEVTGIEGPELNLVSEPDGLGRSNDGYRSL